MTERDTTVTVRPPTELPTGALVTHLAMALGRIEEICYRQTIGSRIIDILGVVATVKDTVAGHPPAADWYGQPFPPAVPEPGPFGPRRPYATDPPVPDRLSSHGPLFGDGYVPEPPTDRVDVLYVPGHDGLATDPACPRCHTVHIIGTPCPPDQRPADPPATDTAADTAADTA